MGRGEEGLVPVSDLNRRYTGVGSKQPVVALSISILFLICPDVYRRYNVPIIIDR
jgi:hypothetical protein